MNYISAIVLFARAASYHLSPTLMRILPIKTEKLMPFSRTLPDVLERNLKNFNEKNILVVTSKIVSICAGRVVRAGGADKNSLIEREADYFLPARKSRYGITLTIKNGVLIPSAGIDESNGNGYYILWPQNPQKTANDIRRYLCRRFKIKKAGVLITDSTTSPLRWGTTGIAIGHSGFQAVNNYIGQPDLFGRRLKVTKANVADALAAGAVAVMGEGREQTPLAVIRDVSFVKFQQRNPSLRELKLRRISIRDDIYAPIFTAVKWQSKSKRKRAV